MKVGGIKGPVYTDSYIGITPPTFIPPLEPFDKSQGKLKPQKHHQKINKVCGTL